MRLIIVTSCLLLAFPAFAAPSGVLIGLRDNSNTYRTIWIVAESSGPVVVADVKGLVIPRENGFWRIDVEEKACGEIGQYLVDELQIDPLGSGSGAPTTSDCEAVAKASCGTVYPAGGGLMLEHWLLYVGPTHFAERFAFMESCGAHPVGETAFAVHEIDHPEEDLPMQVVSPEGSVDALQMAARQALICSTDDLDCIDLRDNYQVSPSSGWGIVRGAGQWSILVALSPPESSDLAPSPVVTDLPAPVAILGASDGWEPTTAIEGLPEGDRSFSPAGDMVIVRTDQVAAYRLVEGTVEGAPVPIPTRSDEQVVMIEWASASQVASWGALLQGISNGDAMSQSMGIERVAWLQGCWESVSENRIIEEHWMAPRGGSMLGVSRTVQDGSLTGYELVVLREQGERLAFEAHPSGQPAAVFVSSSTGEQSVVFENPQHDFPQRIGYERQGDGLLGWIEGTQGGEVRRIEFPYRRAACTGAMETAR
ncbi:MAG: DUF6265 family protein [Vicinamibacteria bacterium]